jgi:hypothetical protein
MDVRETHFLRINRHPDLNKSAGRLSDHDRATQQSQRHNFDRRHVWTVLKFHRANSHWTRFRARLPFGWMDQRDCRTRVAVACEKFRADDIELQALMGRGVERTKANETHSVGLIGQQYVSFGRVCSMHSKQLWRGLSLGLSAPLLFAPVVRLAG